MIKEPNKKKRDSMSKEILKTKLEYDVFLVPTNSRFWSWNENSVPREEGLYAVE